MYLRTLSVLSVLILVCACSDDGPELPKLNLLSQTWIPGNLTTDVWGYQHPDSGKEYAIVGDFSDLREGNVTMVDISEPTSPQVVSTVPGIVGFDMKTFDNFLYVTNSDFPSAVDDSSRIMNIQNPQAPVPVGAFQPAHNIFIDGSYLYLSFEFAPGLRIFDIASDPTKPLLVWEDINNSGGHDVAVIRDRMYDFHAGSGTYIYDVEDPANPQLLGSVQNPNTYHHSGWVTEDDNYLFICDETAADPLPDITIWNIADPGNPTMVGSISDNTSRAHNLYIIDNLAYVSYYGAGLKIFDVSAPAAPVLLDQFDTNVNGGDGIGNGFLGAFGVYPFLTSGNILVSDMDNDLFVFEYR